MSDYEIITDGGRRRCWTSSEKLRIAEETLEENASISVVARRNGVAPNLLYRWRRLMLEGRAVTVSGHDDAHLLSICLREPLRPTALRRALGIRNCRQLDRGMLTFAAVRAKDRFGPGATGPEVLGGKLPFAACALRTF